MKKFAAVFTLLVIHLLCYASPSSIHQSKAFEDRNEQWQKFRARFRYHIQLITLKKYADNSYNIILSELPNRVTLTQLKAEIRSFDAELETRQWRIGVDGWVKDVLISIVDVNNFQLENLLAQLNNLIFSTSYKAEFLDLDNLPTVISGKKLNFQVSAAEITKWLITDGERFYSIGNKSKASTLTNILTIRGYGEYLSQKKGFVLWVLPTNNDISVYEKTIRQFALDADLIIGAVHLNGALAIIGRQRQNSIYALPPLRTESVLMLAAANKTELAQSYERNSLFAGKMTNGKDWAPIYLSDELINTEYGSLLNITDQMLKSWSQKGQIRYDNFPYPYPGQWPFRKTMFDEIGSGSLTYNWNTRGVGYSLTSGKMQVYAVNRTGALPVSYFPDSTEMNPGLSKYEEGAYEYFSSLNDPNLVRVGQYTLLYQIFSAFNITAAKTHLGLFQKPQDVLTEPTIALLRKIIAKDELTMLELELGGKRREALNFSNDLKKYNRRYGESGLIEIAKLANDRAALFQIDKSYFRLVKLIREHEDLFFKIEEYRLARNELVPQHNILGRNLKRSSAEEVERQMLDAQITQYDKLINPLKAELLRMRDEIKGLALAADERADLRTKILQRISLARTLVEFEFEIRDSIKTRYSEANNAVNTNSWIKTPSIVISQDVLHAEMTGGHNIDASIDRFVLDPTVTRGSFKFDYSSGKRIVKISPADAGRVNSNFLTTLRNANSVSSTGTASNLQRQFNGSPPPPPRNPDLVFGTFEDGGGFNAKRSIGWDYEEAESSQKALHINKTDDGLYRINNKKTAVCYNIKEAIEEHLKRQPDAEGIIEFANFTNEEVRFFSENVMTKLTNGNRRTRYLKVFRGKRESITAESYDFVKSKIERLDDGTTRITVPRKTEPKDIKIDIIGLATNVYQLAKTKIQKVFKIGAANSKLDIVNGMISEFKAAGIPFEKIIISADDCYYCINYKGLIHEHI